MSKKQFLLETFKDSAKLTYHVDELRNKLTSFYITFAGLIGTALVYFARSEYSKQIEEPEFYICILLTIIGVIGIIKVVIMARLRKVQIESFRIINNIRTYFLKENYELWNVVQLSERTIPKPNRTSGTYFWLLIIIIISSLLLASAGYLFAVNVTTFADKKCDVLTFLALLIIFLFCEDRLYFYLCKLDPQRKYSNKYTPWIYKSNE